MLLLKIPVVEPFASLDPSVVKCVVDTDPFFRTSPEKGILPMCIWWQKVMPIFGRKSPSVAKYPIAQTVWFSNTPWGKKAIGKNCVCRSISPWLIDQQPTNDSTIWWSTPVPLGFWCISSPLLVPSPGCWPQVGAFTTGWWSPERKVNVQRTSTAHAFTATAPEWDARFPQSQMGNKSSAVPQFTTLNLCSVHSGNAKFLKKKPRKGLLQLFFGLFFFVHMSFFFKVHSAKGTHSPLPLLFPSTFSCRSLYSRSWTMPRHPGL